MITKNEMQYVMASGSPDAQKRISNGETVAEIVYGRSLQPSRDPLEGLFYLFQGDRDRERAETFDQVSRVAETVVSEVRGQGETPSITPETPIEIPSETRSDLPLGETLGKDRDSPEGTQTGLDAELDEILKVYPVKPKKSHHKKGKY